MNRTYVFNKPPGLNNEVINTFDLKKVLSNDRTTILQNEEMRFSIDSKVIRVLLFDQNNTALLEKLRNYFYGDAYEKL